MPLCELAAGKSASCAHEESTLVAKAQFFKAILLAVVLFHLKSDVGFERASQQANSAASPATFPAVAAQTTALAANHNGTSGKQIWQRPGCYQVGHTRTISIPGCVKFSLSTNACRGYCMSFSIPAAEDIGPPSRELLERLVGAPETEPNLANTLSGDFAPYARMKRARHELPSKRRLGGLMSLIEPDSSLQPGASLRPRKLQEFHLLAGQTHAPLADAVGNTGEKRDVISVGQCCNMMETEDVTVNLRCGLNETRRLVFKSAKTCECFFCKHV